MKKCHFIFPGQGSQSVGMLSSIIDTDIAKNTLKKPIQLLDMTF